MSDQLQGIMNTSMEKIRDLVDVDSIIGTPITCPDGTVIIPISRVSFGFVSGGSDLPAKITKDVFAGGSGAGVTIKPQAFLVIKKDGNVVLLETGRATNFVDGLVDSVPDMVSKIKDVFSKEKEPKTEDFSI
jgi:sporulation protein YtfJ